MSDTDFVDLAEEDDDEPMECLEAGPDCKGPIELHTTGDSLRAWPRCEYHQEKRWERYENSLERWANSDVAPDWFDPSIAGERWEDD